MDTIYLILLLAVVGAVSLALYFMLRPGKPKKTTESLYSDGLRLLLEGELKAAADRLKEVVKRDTNHIDAYIKLGDLYRQSHQYDQALKVHQSLTVRRDVTLGQKVDIHLSLVGDYKALGNYEKALAQAEKVLEIDKKHVKGLRAKLDIYRLTNQWEEATDTLKHVQKQVGEENNELLALYRVQEGLNQEEQGEAKEGRTRYRKALKIDPGCCAALYYLGNSYEREERTEEAVENWEKFGEICPDKLYLVSEKIEQSLFSLGNFSEVERYYKRLLDSHPENIEAAVGIANFYDKKGETDQAIQTLENVLDKNPDSVRGHIMLIRLYNKKQQSDAVEAQLEQMLSSATILHTFQCRYCGHTASDFHWLCPGCHQKDTFVNGRV